MKLKLKIKLKSSMLPGSGSGAGAMIDNDVIWDECGLPYIPGKRIKGCLKDAALEVLDMFSLNRENLSKLGFLFYNINEISNDLNSEQEPIIKDLFGVPDNEQKSCITINNLFIKNQKEITQWLEYLLAQEDSIVTLEKIKNQFTEIRTSTTIDHKTGVAKKNSLRTSRYLIKDLVFNGEIDLDDSNNQKKIKDWKKILGLACANFKIMGTRRNRGTGDIKCTLWDNNEQIKPAELKNLE